MRITGTTSTISFGGYQNILKTMYKSGRLPEVKYGIYGDKLTKENVSLEHIIPHSKGGLTETSNLALSSKRNNNARGDKDISLYLTKKNLKRYIGQFIGLKRDGFNGNSYIIGLLKTINSLLVN